MVTFYQINVSDVLTQFFVDKKTFQLKEHSTFFDIVNTCFGIGGKSIYQLESYIKRMKSRSFSQIIPITTS